MHAHAKHLSFVLFALFVLVSLFFSPPVRGATYIVDRSHPAAGDQNPGTEEKPFLTVQRAADAAKAGDLVRVMEGNYPERVAIKNSGAERKWVQFQALPTGSVTVMGFDIVDQSYLRFEGFRISQDKPKVRTSGMELGKGAHHVQIAACHFQSLYQGISGAASDVEVVYCRFYQVQFGSICSGDRWRVENCDYERMYYFDGNGGMADCDYSRFWGKGHVVRCNRYHDTLRKEVGQAHLDVVQTFNLKKDDPATCLQDLTFEDNVCSSFSQGFMVSTSTPGAMARMTFRRNIFWKGLNWDGCAAALSLSPVNEAEVTNNTFANIVWYGVRNLQGKGSRMSDNIFWHIAIPYTKGEDFSGQRNLVQDCNTPVKSPGAGEVVGGEPKFADPNAGNFRLLAGSAAAQDANSPALGALAVPNAYYVNPLHPGASDDGFGYAGWPFKTAAKALAVAKSGETIVLRGIVYHETLRPAADGITIRAEKGEPAIISGADLIEGWRREAQEWSAPLASAPKQVLRDGKPWTEYRYDASAKRIAVSTGGDPRMHLFEMVVRKEGIDLAGKKDVKIEGVRVAKTLEAAQP